MPTVRLARVHRLRELLHIVQRDGVEAGDGAERDVAVRRAAEDVGLQPLLAELLFVVRPQILDERVQLRLLQALEVVFAEARIQELRQDGPEEPRPVVAVDDAGERGHLLVGASGERAGHRVQRGVDLIDGHRPRAGLRDHRGGERGQPLLPGGIVRGSDREEQLDVELRQHRLLKDQPRGRVASRRRGSQRGRSRRRRGGREGGCRRHRIERRRVLDPRGQRLARQRRHDQARVGEVLASRRLQIGRLERIERAVVVVDGVVGPAVRRVAGHHRGDALRAVERARERVAVVRLGVGELLGRHQGRAGGRDGGEDLVAHVHRVRGLFHAGEHREQRRIEARRHVHVELVDFLLGDDEPLVQIGGGAEVERADHLHRRRVLAGFVERRPRKRDRDVGERAARPGHVRVGGALRVQALWGSRPSCRRRSARDPSIFNDRHHLFGRDISGHHDGRVCGRYQRSKNTFEYSYSFGMFSMSAMKPIVVCL